MIAIVNVSDHDDLVGGNDYELRINNIVIAKFQHKRADGLAMCLRKAADAAQKAHDDEALAFLKKMVESEDGKYGDYFSALWKAGPREPNNE